MVNILYLRQIKCNLLFNENNKDTCIYKLILFLHVLNHVKALKRYISVARYMFFFLLIKQNLVLILSNY